MNNLEITLLDNNEQADAQLIKLSINSNVNAESLFTGRVDLRSLIDWLLEKERAIREDDFPINNLNGHSLAENSYCFYESVDSDNDDAIDAMYNYRTSHCLRFACRGTNIPDIYIGRNEGEYEISKYTLDEEWRYFFDINDFFSKIERYKFSY
ncbi:hypothetical protein [Buttiauxella ferragutiae]|uniref:hypothetical protein n=1 Tax=Buttiauxella ferragutiae TaxID=82989 RepID=UPI001F539E49|nr:hypothetical protein [Buttiauxella ferragutiae]UNK63072.1 hypothetical protein MNO13_09205 [Buttiauxella ferragutiae]